MTTTVIVINGNAGCNENSGKTNSHRSVTKPRDVKNKSNRTKMILKMSPPNSKSPSPPMIVPTDKFIQQSGSVYCSLYGDMSEDDNVVCSYA